MFDDNHTCAFVFWQDRYVHGKMRNYFLNIFIYVVYIKVCTIVAQRSFYFLGVFYIDSMPNKIIFKDMQGNKAQIAK